MAIVLESISTQAITAGSSTTITKPTGLAVGDTMIALIGSPFSAGGATTITPPSGWTSIQNGSYQVSITIFTYAAFYKTADSSDVAASNFTFSQPTYGQYMGGAIARVSGFGIIDDSSFVSSAAASPTSIASAITPTRADSLNFVLLIAGDNMSGSTTVSFSNPSIATDNPTWTGHLDSAPSIPGAPRYGVAIYSATRSASTAWGNITLTYVQNSGADIGGVLINIAPRVDSSHSISTAPMYVVNQPFIRNGQVAIDATDPTTSSREYTNWSAESKPSTSWTKETI